MSEKVNQYISRLGSPQKEICEKLREIILRVLPGVIEEFRWGVPVYGGGKYYIGALRDHVNLGFSIAGLLDDELALLEGSGKTMRHIKIYSLEDIDEDKINKLLKMVKKHPKHK
jgi:hypothetical protein